MTTPRMTTPRMTTPRMTTPRLTGARRVAFASIVCGAVGIALAYASAFAPPAIAWVGPWLMAVSLPVCLIAMMTFGAVRDGRSVGTLALPIAFVFLLVTGGFLVALALPPDDPAAALWLGLPHRAAVILYGVGVLPLFVLPVAYALTFDAFTLSDADIERVRLARQTDLPSGAPVEPT